MRVEAGKQASQNAMDRCTANGATGETIETHGESRALVVTSPVTPPSKQSSHRQATFLAHLIATKEHAPQTCERRRAEPSEAHAAYRRAAALIPV